MRACRLAILTAALLLGACATAPPVTLNGELTYRERVALPEDVYARVALLELREGGNEFVSEQELRRPGQVPIPFQLVVPREILEEARQYGLRAAIYDRGGTVRWITPETHRVDPFAPPESIELELRRVTSD